MTPAMPITRRRLKTRRLNLRRICLSVRVKMELLDQAAPENTGDSAVPSLPRPVKPACGRQGDRRQRGSS